MFLIIRAQDILLNCLRNHHLEEKRAVHIQKEPNLYRRRLQHTVCGFVVNLLGVWREPTLFYLRWLYGMKLFPINLSRRATAYKRPNKTMRKLFFILCMAICSVCLTSCGGGDDNGPSGSISNPTLNKSSITLYVDETSTLTYSGGDCTWKSENALVASVANGVVTGKHVGETTIYANSLACKVIVKPRYTSFTEPYLGWGASQATVKNNMSGYTLKSSSTTSLQYNGKGSINSYIYNFTDGSLSSCAFYSYPTYMYSLSDYLNERYVVYKVDEDKKNIYFLSVDGKNMIAFALRSTSDLIVVYVPVSSSSTSSKSTSVDEKEQAVQALESQLQELVNSINN